MRSAFLGAQRSEYLQRPYLWNDGIALLRVAIDHGIDGIVDKRLVKGRSDAWLKVRASTAWEQSRR